MAPMSNRSQRVTPDDEVVRGLMHRWRIGGRNIPGQVASPQSLTPFLPAISAYRLSVAATTNRTVRASSDRISPPDLTKRRSVLCWRVLFRLLPAHTERRHETRSTVYQPVALACQSTTVLF